MLKGIILSKLFGSVLRHALSGVGVWLVSEGYADETTAKELIGGVMAVSAVGMSFAQKLL